MTREISSDLAIIGSGPAGYYAAIQAAKLGKKVVLVEKKKIGGACLHYGTIPSKTLREAILELSGFHNRELFRGEPAREISPKKLVWRLQQVILKEEEIMQRRIQKNGILLVQGRAEFADPHHLQIYDEEGKIEACVTSDFFIIATGSCPNHPLAIPFEEKTILDSNQLLELEEIPESLIILGGGVIGSEYACYFSLLGTQVFLIDQKRQMLPFLDSEIGAHLQSALTDIGLSFYGERVPEKITCLGEKVEVTFTEGESLTASALFCALGRVPHLEGLGLDKLALQCTERGFLSVNALFQTSLPHIYAVGDVIGHPALASTAMEQGRVAARYACGKKNAFSSPFHPIGIYTIPEISSYGHSEDQLKEMNVRYEVGRAYYYEISRSHISCNETGLFKILFHPETLTILGIHIIGKGATEVIHIGQVAMSFNAPLSYFVEHVFNYPTYAEGFRIAALNGLNKLKHSPSKLLYR